MLPNRNSMKPSLAIGSAERCNLVQFAVAIWGALLGATLGCVPSNHNVTKYQIDSSSMAPMWFGPHLTATCTHCRQQSLIVREAYDSAVPNRCFSCGEVCTSDDDLRRGEVIEITRCTTNTPLKRFDVVTFDSQERDDAESQPSLKRVWALPGESIELHDGEAWIEGKLLQKTAVEFAAICVPVSCFPKDNRSHWWIVNSKNSEAVSIETAANGEHLKLKTDQRLEFRYVRPNRNHEIPEMLPSPIVDDFTFNQNSIAQFHEVADFLLAIELERRPLATWCVGLQSKGKHHRICVGSSNELCGKSKLDFSVADGALRLLIAVCDGRLLASTDNQNSLWQLVDLDGEFKIDNAVRDSLITITATETLHINRLLVARDQWLGPRESRLTDWQPDGSKAEMESQVSGGYFLLGDNLEMSIDSRDTAVGRIARERIAGRGKRLGDSPEWILTVVNHAFREVVGR